MKSREEITKALNAIRKVLDADVIDSDIISQQNKLLSLTQLLGLSSEAKASAKKLLHLKELEILIELNISDLSPSVIGLMLKAKCAEELAILEYSDRINSAVIHSIDSIRSVISLYKTELENSLK